VQDLNPTSELRQLLKSATPASATTTVASAAATSVKPEFSTATDLSTSSNRYGLFSSPSSHTLTSSIPPPLSSDLPQSLATSSLDDLNDLDELGNPRQRHNFRGLTHTSQYQVRVHLSEAKFLVTKFEFGGSFGMSLEGDFHDIEVTHILELFVTFGTSFIHNFTTS
jgi:hypothetical protein